jgi:hypothetical protein
MSDARGTHSCVLSAGNSESCDSSSVSLVRLAGRLQYCDLYLAVVPDFRHWPEEIEQPKPCFRLLTALETGDASTEELAEFASKLLDQGCGAADAWGSDADRMHLAFDFAWVEREERGELPCGLVVTTGATPADESLDEALWHTLHVSWPEDEETADVLVVTEPLWAEAIEARLSNPEQLSRDVVNDDGDWTTCWANRLPNPAPSALRPQCTGAPWSALGRGHGGSSPV